MSRGSKVVIGLSLLWLFTLPKGLLSSPYMTIKFIKEVESTKEKPPLYEILPEDSPDVQKGLANSLKMMQLISSVACTSSPIAPSTSCSSL